MKKKLQEHISHNDYLEKEDAQSMVSKQPFLKYNGESYRVLLFQNEEEKCDISNDTSFAKNISGIEYYFMKQDVINNPYAQLYKVEIIGLDVEKAALAYSLTEHKEMIQKEAEVIAIEVLNQELLFNGKATDLDDFLKKIS
jgi:hypothetical protein